MGDGSPLFEVRVRNLDSPGEIARPGEYLAFDIVDPDPAHEFRVLMQHGPLLHLTPTRDWDHERYLRWHSPGPGRYRFWFERRREAEHPRWPHRLGLSRPLPPIANGVERVEVEVEGDAGVLLEPTRLRTPEGIELWIPGAWEASRYRGGYEPELRRALLELVRPGDVIFDLGANLGAHTVDLSRATGPAGRVYAFEANPVCIAFLRANLEVNGVTNATILPIAAGEADGPIDFLVDFGNSALGTVASSPLFAEKSGQRVQVDCRRVDDLVDRGLAETPDLVKIDIEGGELLALRGMERLLSARGPRLFIELHGPQAAGESLRQLDRLGYRHRLVDRPGSWFSAGELDLDSVEHVFQVLSVRAPETA